MSERSAALGIKAPPKTIEHDGKTYAVAPVLTEGTMLAVEEKMYARDKAALLDLRDAYPKEEFVKRLDELRAQKAEGFYSFESERTLKTLQTTDGAVLLLTCMMSATEAEIFALLTERPAEMEEFLNEAMADSLPDVPTPKPSARARAAARAKKKKRK